MHNIAEEITGEYLRHIKGCEFVEYNVKGAHQTEIDVVGLNILKKEVYICEVAAHILGLQYVNQREKRPDTKNRFIQKFLKDKEYTEQHFAHFTPHYMLWSPIVKEASPKAKYNALKSVCEVKEGLYKNCKIDLELVINQAYQQALEQLRAQSRKIHIDLSNSSVLRYLQIEEHLKKHLK